MNILILTSKLPYPPRDGGAIATLNIATGLSDSGHHVILLAMNTTKHYFNPGRIPEKLRNKITIITIDVKTRIRWPVLLWNFFFSKRPYNAVRFHSEQFSDKLKDIIIKEKSDIVQIEGPYLDYCIPLVRENCKAKISFRAHNLEYEIWERRARQTKNPILRLYIKVLSARIRKLEQSLISKTDMIVPISERDQDGFIKLGLSCPSIVCPAGLDIRSYPDPSPITGISLFYIGALDWAPNTEGLDWFFDNVWERLSDLHPGIKMHIAGRNPDFYFRRKKETTGVIIKGEVEDAHAFINYHSVMIVPLLSGSGIRVKILEGMLLGRTVITTSTGAEGLDVTDGRNILIANTADEFLAQIDKLIKSPDIARWIGSAARQFVKENFDNLVIAKKLADFYTLQQK
jgi:glycosyltransferase involved in cell wall biosynthesis